MHLRSLLAFGLVLLLSAAVKSQEVSDERYKEIMLSPFSFSNETLNEQGIAKEWGGFRVVPGGVDEQID